MELEIKRFYMPGALVLAVCPECGEVITYDLGTNYLSYPSTGEQELSMYHETGDGMEHEWTVRVDLQLRLVAVDGCEIHGSD